MDGDDFGGGFNPGGGGNWRPVPTGDMPEGNSGAKLYMQAGSKMNDMPFGDEEEAPF